MNLRPDPFAVDFEDRAGSGLTDLIGAELERDEPLLWTAPAIPESFWVSPGEIGCLAIVTIYFCGATGFVFLAYRTNLDATVVVFLGTLLGLIGLAMGGGTALGAIESWRKFRRRNHRLYALTDRRAILWVLVPGRPREVYSIPRGKVTNVYRVENPDGSGDVVFSLVNGFQAYRISGGDFLNMPSGFEGVEKVRHVEDLVRQVLIVPDESAEPLEN